MNSLQNYSDIDTTKFHEYRDYEAVQLLLDTEMRILECLAMKVVDINNRAVLLPAEDTKNTLILIRPFEEKLKDYG